MRASSSNILPTLAKSAISRPIAWWVAALVLLAATPAVAQDADRQDFKDTIHVVQQKPVLQNGRLDLVPRFGMSINDAMYRHFQVGLNANYHFTENVYLGARFDWYNFGDALGGPTGAFKAAQNATRSTSDAAVVNWNGGLELGYAPIVGKFAFADSFIIYYDMAVVVGGAYLNTESVALPGDRDAFGGSAALVTRVFFNDWLALNLELRDLIFSADLRGQTGALTHLVTAAAGFSFYLPTAFEYSEPGSE